MKSPWGLSLLLMLTVMTASGANCSSQINKWYQPARPQVLSASPTLGEVIEVVNSNTAKVTSLSTSDASVSAPMTPTLGANIAIERPRRFRLQAATRLTGAGVDLGSNNELFWFWFRGLQPTPVFYCRHDQYAGSAAKQMVPVEPEWLLEAIGLTGFDPAGQHTGPQPAGDGRLEIRTTIPRPEGTVTKVTIVDSIAGWVLEQHLYDQQGARIASSITSKQFTDPVTGVTLPKKIEIQWPATQFSMTIDMGTVVINQIGGDPAQLFEMPRTGGVQVVDMGDPNFRAPGAPPQPVAVPTYPTQQPVLPTAARQPITIAPPSTVWQPSMR